MAGAKSPKQSKGDETREADWEDHTRQEPTPRDAGLALRAVISSGNNPAPPCRFLRLPLQAFQQPSSPAFLPTILRIIWGITWFFLVASLLASD